MTKVGLHVRTYLEVWKPSEGSDQTAQLEPSLSSYIVRTQGFSFNY